MEKDKDNVYDEYIKESKLQMQQHQTSDNEVIFILYVVDATTQEENNIPESQYDFFTNFKSDIQEVEVKKKR